VGIGRVEPVGSLRRLIREDEADKTPVRPPSQNAMQAFQASSEFLKKKP